MIFGYYIEGPLTSSLSAGFIFWLAGWFIKRYPPKWPNYLYGYRTMFSLKSKASFDAANIFSGTLMRKYGKGLMIWGIVLSLFFHENYWWVFLAAGMLPLLVAVIALVYNTEKYLKLNFDPSGQPRVKS